MQRIYKNLSDKVNLGPCNFLCLTNSAINNILYLSITEILLANLYKKSIPLLGYVYGGIHAPKSEWVLEHFFAVSQAIHSSFLRSDKKQLQFISSQCARYVSVISGKPEVYPIISLW